MSDTYTVVEYWRDRLERVLERYDSLRNSTRFFHAKLFLLFVVINILCYWLGMITAFPDLVFGEKGAYYFKMQLPVGILAAVFESISFTATVYLIRQACRSRTPARFFVHVALDISVDGLIGLVGTLWIIATFAVSSWMVKVWDGQTDPLIVVHSESVSRDSVTGEEVLTTVPVTKHILEVKKDYYISIIQEALLNPFRSWRNLYFGLVMSISEMFPTLLHSWILLVAISKRRALSMPTQ